MISRPSRLEDWTLDLVREIATSRHTENDWYDLKEDLQDKVHQRKIVASLANTQGGFLVFGVTNDRRVIGVDNPEFPRDFENKLTHGLHPTVEFTFSASLPVSARSAVWVCEIPRSRRRAHAVLIDEDWVFPRRTESGSNVSMNVKEIRATFLDSGGRSNELAWLRAEVDRIRKLAKRVNEEGSAGVASDLDLVLTKFDVTRIKTLLVSVFSFLDKNHDLVDRMHALIERCERVDDMLAPMAPFEILPRDRSYSGGCHDWRRFLMQNAPQIAMEFGLVLRGLDELK